MQSNTTINTTFVKFIVDAAVDNQWNNNAVQEKKENSINKSKILVTSK